MKEPRRLRSWVGGWDVIFGVLIVQLTVVSMAMGTQTEKQVSSAVYIVRLKGPPVTAYEGSVEGLAATAQKEGGKLLQSSRQAVEAYADYLRQAHDSVLEEVMEIGSYEKLYSYTVVLNGFAVKLINCAKQAELLDAHPLVISTEPDTLFQKETTHTPNFLGLPAGPWAINGGPEYAGEGIVIGMLDTGIDPTHPSFTKETWNRPYGPLQKWKGECVVSETFPLGSCNGKIIGAQYFDKGIIAANLFNATYDFDSALDGDGHGTHTSSIAAGSSRIPVIVKGYNYGHASGMAPRARIAVYKVVFRDGGFLSDVLAGIDKAVQDGVDILSISLGSISSGTGVPCLNTFDVALLFAVKAGITVVHAAGNNGPYPQTMKSFGPWIISVAAGLNDRSYPNSIILRDNEQFPGSGLSVGTPGEVWHPLIYSEDAFSDSTTSLDFEYFSYCQDSSPFNATLIKNKILICNYIDYGSGDSINQFQNAIATAMNMSAAGLLIMSKASEVNLKEKPIILDPFPFPLPGVFVSDSNVSRSILRYYYSRAKRDNTGKITEFGARVRLNDSRQASFVTEAPQVALFSSRGPVYANTINMVMADLLKPDLVAPGNQIWGAWTPTGIDATGYSGESFAMLSGTSMATPHIAGIVALLQQQHPHWSPAAIQSALLTTASPFDSWHAPILAEQPSQNPASTMLGSASPFDLGSGAVNATAAFNPGLVFERSFQDYVNFLCTLPGLDANTVEDATGVSCQVPVGERASNLNMPSITVANLIGTRVVNRTVTSYYSEDESYAVIINPPSGVDVMVEPGTFTISSQEAVTLTVTLRAVANNQAFTFGSLALVGSKGHVVRMPLSVSANSDVDIHEQEREHAH